MAGQGTAFSLSTVKLDYRAFNVIFYSLFGYESA